MQSKYFALTFLIALSAQAADLKTCLAATGSSVVRTTKHFVAGSREAPGNAMRPGNLKWELPVVATAGVLIVAADQAVRENPPSRDVSDASDAASNYLLGAQAGAAFFTYAIGCAKDNDRARDAGLQALVAMGFAVVSDYAMKAATNREYPDKWNGQGRWWAGGKSFPSGHSAAAFALAGALGRQYPSRKVRWPLYVAAVGVSGLRVPALKHYPSDVVVGATLGFVIGHFLGRQDSADSPSVGALH